MEQKYLPIGSVCTLKGKNKKVMITGYYSVEFNGNLRIKDYCGCVYPEGMLLPEHSCTFNHTDIETIDFIGFKNDEQKTFQGLLNRLTGNNLSEEESAAKFHKDNDMFLTSNSSYSKLLFDENGVVMIADPVKQQPKESNDSIFKNITFDEKGYVVSAQTEEEVNNPFYKEYNTTESKEEKDSSEWNIFNKIEFDENGTVINAETNKELDSKSILNKIEFDENGTVISVNSETLKQEQNYDRYKFDENGTLIALGETKLEEQEPQILEHNESLNKIVNNYKFDENGNIISEEVYEFDNEGNVVNVKNNKLEEADSSVESIQSNKYKFDENGTIIAVNDEKEEKNVNRYQFDSEGNVISDSQSRQTTSQTLSNIQFDENGTVVSA